VKRNVSIAVAPFSCVERRGPRVFAHHQSGKCGASSVLNRDAPDNLADHHGGSLCNDGEELDPLRPSTQIRARRSNYMCDTFAASCDQETATSSLSVRERNAVVGAQTPRRRSLAVRFGGNYVRCAPAHVLFRRRKFHGSHHARTHGPKPLCMPGITLVLRFARRPHAANTVRNCRSTSRPRLNERRAREGGSL
jgi:hypothetical protein